MPFNETGQFTRLYSFADDKTNNVLIRSDRMDGEFDNIVSALNRVALADGSKPFTGDLDLGGYALIGLGDGTAALPAVRFTNGGLYERNNAIAVAIGGFDRMAIGADSIDFANLEFSAAGLNSAVTANGDLLLKSEGLVLEVASLTVRTPGVDLLTIAATGDVSLRVGRSLGAGAGSVLFDNAGWTDLTNSQSGVRFIHKSTTVLALDEHHVGAQVGLIVTGPGAYPATGAGLELEYVSGEGWVTVIDRSAGQTSPLNFRASLVRMTGNLLVAGNQAWHAGNFNPASKADAVHTHAIADVIGLEDALAAASGGATTIGGIVGLQDALDSKAPLSHTHDYLPLTGGNLTGDITILGNTVWHSGSFDPADKADVVHVHAMADITGLADALAAKADASHAHSEYLMISGGTVTGDFGATAAVTLGAIDKPVSITSSSFTLNAPGAIIAAGGGATFTSVTAGDATVQNDLNVRGDVYLGYGTKAVIGVPMLELNGLAEGTLVASNSGLMINRGDLLPSATWHWDEANAWWTSNGADMGGLGAITATVITGTLVGNAATASQWSTARTITASGDVGGSYSLDGSADRNYMLTISLGSVTNIKLADMAAGTIKGRAGVDGAPQDLNATQARALLAITNVEDKSSETIRDEITAANVGSALGFTPANSAHGHTAADIADLAPLLAGKADSAHVHAITDVTGLDAALGGKSNVGHGHTLDSITGLQLALDGKAPAAHDHPYLPLSGGALTGGVTINGHTVYHAGNFSMAGMSDSATAPVLELTDTQVTVSADLVPDVDNMRSLGTASKRWKDIFVSANTIYLGDSTQLSGTSIVVDAGENPTALSQMPTLQASKIVAVPYTFNPGGGPVVVRPSIEFQVGGQSYPISFNTTTLEFSLDAQGDYGQGKLVAKAINLSDGFTVGGAISHSGNYLNTVVGASFRHDGNSTFGYDAANSLTVRATTTFQGPVAFQGGVSLGDGNDAITLAGSNATLTAGGHLTLGGGLVVNGNLTVNGGVTSVTSNEVNIGDSIILLNADIGVGEVPTQDGGIQIARGSQAAVSWVWNEANDYWTPNGGNMGNIGSLAATSVTATNFAGALTGNASSADRLHTPRTIALEGAVTGSASFDGSSNITITTIGSGGGSGGGDGVEFRDAQAVNLLPQDYPAKKLVLDLKATAYAGSPPVIANATDGFAHIATFAGGATNDGATGLPSQLSFGDGLALRQAVSATSWGPWRTLWHDGNFNPANYLPKTGGALSGGLSVGSNLLTSGNLTLQDPIGESWSMNNFINFKDKNGNERAWLGYAPYSSNFRMVNNGNIEITANGGGVTIGGGAMLALGGAGCFIANGGGNTLFLGAGNANSVVVTQGDNQWKVWNEGNFNPANYAALSGANFTGLLTTRGFRPYGVASNSGAGFEAYTWGYQEAGPWVSPYPNLVIGYETGIKFGSNILYGGIKFYDKHPGAASPNVIMSVGAITPDVRVTNSLFLGGLGLKESANVLRLTNADGWTEIGPRNAHYVHFLTDMPQGYHFNKTVSVGETSITTDGRIGHLVGDLFTLEGVSTSRHGMTVNAAYSGMGGTGTTVSGAAGVYLAAAGAKIVAVSGTGVTVNGALTATSISAGTITGSISGNAATASLATAVRFTDTRSVASPPSQKIAANATFDFKQRGIVDMPPVSASASYAHIMSVAGWTDYSGGYPSQLSFGDGLSVRQAVSDTTWGPWRTFWHDANFNPGNYLLLTGGTVTGDLTANLLNSTTGSYRSRNRTVLYGDHLATVYYSPDAGYHHFCNSTGSAVWASVSNGMLTTNGQVDAGRDVKARGLVRAAGWWNDPKADPNGLATEIGSQGGMSYVYSYDRTAAAFGPLVLGGSSVKVGNGNFEVQSGTLTVSGISYLNGNANMLGGGRLAHQVNDTGTFEGATFAHYGITFGTVTTSTSPNRSTIVSGYGGLFLMSAGANIMSLTNAGVTVNRDITTANNLTAAIVTGTEVYASNWLRTSGTGGVYWQAYSRGITSPDGSGASYGNVDVYGNGRNGYQGYTIGNDISFMTNGVARGFYSQARGAWLLNFDNSNNAVFPANVTAYSDERLKKNIRPIEGALGTVKALTGIRYERDGKTRVGVGAQTTRKALPEVVHESDDLAKTLSVNYGDMVGVLIEAIKELSEKVDRQAEIIARLEDKYAKMGVE